VGAIFDVPITVTLKLDNGKVLEEVIVVSEAVVERRIEAPDRVRSVSFNDDNATVATIEKG
jgi:hypothetical protein